MLEEGQYRRRKDGKYLELHEEYDDGFWICEVVEDPENPIYVGFDEVNPADLERLELWTPPGRAA